MKLQSIKGACPAKIIIGAMTGRVAHPIRGGNGPKMFEIDMATDKGI